jgi:hypothetical protein
VYFFYLFISLSFLHHSFLCFSAIFLVAKGTRTEGMGYMTFFPPQTIGAFLSAAYISIIHVVLSEEIAMNILVDVYSG